MANPRVVAFDDLESIVGQEVGVSDWHLIDQDRVNLFANETMQLPANLAAAAEDSNGASAPPELADSGSTASTTAGNLTDISKPVGPHVADVSSSALASAPGAKRPREEEDEARGNDGEEEGAAKRMREEGASSSGDAGITMG